MAAFAHVLRCLGVWLTLASAAFADDRPAPVLIAEVQFAPAGPLGGIGAALDLSVAPWLAINAGVGLAFTNTDTRKQLALTPRVRIPLGRFALGWETGLSVGGHSANFDCFLFDPLESPPCAHWSRVWWVNTNITFEMQEGRAHFRAFAGRGTPLAATGEAYCASWGGMERCRTASSEHPASVANVGVAVGYIF